MTREDSIKILELDGWIIINENPFEIIKRNEEGRCIAEAKGMAIEYIVRELKNQNFLPQEVTLEKVESYHSLTVGELKELLYKFNLPKDGKVLIERVEDTYFKNNNWSVVYKKGSEWYYNQDWNDKFDNGYYDDKEQFPNYDKTKMKKIPEDQEKYLLDQFHPAQSACKFDDDDKNLYIFLHY